MVRVAVDGDGDGGIDGIDGIDGDKEGTGYRVQGIGYRWHRWRRGGRDRWRWLASCQATNPNLKPKPKPNPGDWLHDRLVELREYATRFFSLLDGRCAYMLACIAGMCSTGRSVPPSPHMHACLLAWQVCARPAGVCRRARILSRLPCTSRHPPALCRPNGHLSPRSCLSVLDTLDGGRPRARSQTLIGPTSPGPHVSLVLTKLGPYATLVLTSHGPYLVIAFA